MARDGLRDWMEYGIGWPEENGRNVTREGMIILDGVWHMMA
jgi:hypothetical protein